MLTENQYTILKSILDAEIRVAENDAERMPVSELEEKPFYIHRLINLKTIRKEIEIMEETYREVEWIRSDMLNSSEILDDPDIEKIWVKRLSACTLSIVINYKDSSEIQFQYSGPYLLEWK